MTRLSGYFLPTLREAPADAEAPSHRLLVRAGLARQVGAGMWTWLPAGWRAHRKAEQIVREELDAIGGQEMLMPVLTPAELWEATGRIAIPEIFRLRDRSGREFILPLTHEETVTFHARELQSYRDLPQLWYHFQTKDRDEPRPRGGLLRVREFVMKDAYSFDRDDEGVRASFEANREAYKRIFARCGLETYDVQAESGIMGGKFSIDFLAPSGSGENTLVRCENGDYAGDLEIARAVPRDAVLPEPLDAPEEIETPGVGTIEALAEFLGDMRRASQLATDLFPAVTGFAALPREAAVLVPRRRHEQILHVRTPDRSGNSERKCRACPGPVNRDLPVVRRRRRGSEAGDEDCCETADHGGECHARTEGSHEDTSGDTPQQYQAREQCGAGPGVLDERGLRQVRRAATRTGDTRLRPRTRTIGTFRACQWVRGYYGRHSLSPTFVSLECRAEPGEALRLDLVDSLAHRRAGSYAPDVAPLNNARTPLARETGP